MVGNFQTIFYIVLQLLWDGGFGAFIQIRLVFFYVLPICYVHCMNHNITPSSSMCFYKIALLFVQDSVEGHYSLWMMGHHITYNKTRRGSGWVAVHCGLHWTTIFFGQRFKVELLSSLFITCLDVHHPPRKFL